MTVELEELVQKPTWKQVLLELIITEKLDPWNIDIVKVTRGFIEKIKQMKVLELFIPANMILASAILLRYKSQIMNFREEPATSEFNGEEEVIEKPQIQELKMISRIPPKRPITLNDLMEEIDNVIKYEDNRGKIEKNKVEDIMNLKLEGIDIEKQMNDVYDLVLKQMNGSGHVLFSDLFSEKTNKIEKREIVRTLMSLLHLTQKNRIELTQKEFFGDIFVTAVEEKN